jgi:hypothetical protein
LRGRSKGTDGGAGGRVCPGAAGGACTATFAAIRAREANLAERLAADLSVGKDVKTIDAAKLIDEGKRTDAALSTRMDADLKYAPRDLATLAAPWEMFAKELDKQIRGTADWQGVQIVAMPLDASWNDPKYGKYRAWRLLGDSLPAWGPSYRATQAQVSTGYKIFIDNLDIKPPDPALRRQAEDALDKYNDKLAKMQRLQEKVGEHWLAFDLHQRPLPPNRQLTFDQWYARYDGATIAGTVLRPARWVRAIAPALGASRVASAITSVRPGRRLTSDLRSHSSADRARIGPPFIARAPP